ncbi:MAG: DcaP family trimeric outer membrane transporter [Sphingomicrobium sp.]
MHRGFFFATAAVIATPAWAADAPAADPAAQAAPISDPQQRDSAIREIQELKARINRLETALGVPSTPPPIQYTPAAPSGPKDHNLELYGFLQLDAIQDFNRVNPDWDATLRPSRIPTVKGQFGDDGQSIFSVRQSRLGVKATGSLAGKPYEAKFEFDLFGTGVDAGQTTFRVRHMYAKWGPFLAGQTNTLFMDGDIFPNVVDYWGPAGMVFVRNPQIRWTFLDNGRWTAAVALEHPSDDIDPGRIRLIDENVAANLQANEELPDLTAAIAYKGDWGHVRLAGILRKIGFETRATEGNEPSGHELGWGINATSSIKISLATLRLGAVYGRGIATYMNDGGMDLAPAVSIQRNANGILVVPRAEAVKLLGMSAYSDFNWSKKWTSSIGYSFDKVNNTNFQDLTAFHKGQYASVNLLWHPADNVFTGGELLWGKRTDNDGNSGKDIRFQGTFHWDFSSKNIWGMFE